MGSKAVCIINNVGAAVELPFDGAVATGFCVGILVYIRNITAMETGYLLLGFAVSFVPVNIYLLMLLNKWDFVSDTSWVLGGMQCILYYGIIFSVEQIAMGVITRTIWEKQYKPAPEA